MKKFLLAGVVTLMSITPALAKNSHFLSVIQPEAEQRYEHCDFYIGEVANVGNRYFVAYYGQGGGYSPSGLCTGNLTIPYLAELIKTGSGYKIEELNLLDYHIQLPGSIEDMAISDGNLIILTHAYGQGDGQHRPRDVYRTEVRLADMKVIRTEFEKKLPEEYYEYKEGDGVYEEKYY